jgi:mxaD protein
MTVIERMTVVACTLALAAAGVSRAAAPELSVKKTATIAAPADKVWAATKNFDGLNTWLPALASDEIVSGTNNTVGAVRLLTLKDGGGTIKEKLLAFDEGGKRKDLGDTPAQGQDDKAAVDAIAGVYTAGLGNLKKMLESP